MQPPLSILIAGLVFSSMLPAADDAHAESYVEKKDAAATATVQRAMANLDKDPSLFDGTAIPTGAELARVGQLLDRLTRQLDIARRGFADLSAAGHRRADVEALQRRFDELDAYTRALASVHKAAAAGATKAAGEADARDNAKKMAGIRACLAFTKEMTPEEQGRIGFVVKMAGGAPQHWSTVADGAGYKAAIDKAARLCAKPEYVDVDAGCRYRGQKDDVCAVVSRGDELMKLSAKNFATFLAESFTRTRNATNLEANEGWLESELATTWSEYFSPEKVKVLFRKQLAPIYAQAGMTGADDAEVFAKVDGFFAALEAKTRELAPTWKLEGTACSGVACGVAKQSVARWYPSAKLRQLRQSSPTWKIVSDLGVPTHRYKDGFALLQVKGDPFCQLRSWTVTEQYSGGGRYQAASTATIGYVRWQVCK